MRAIVSTWDPDDLIATHGLGVVAARNAAAVSSAIRSLISSPSDWERSRNARTYFGENACARSCDARFERVFIEASSRRARPLPDRRRLRGWLDDRQPDRRDGESSALCDEAVRVHTAASGVALRPWPYPYEAALAICSDLDETPTADDYFDMMRLLNTTGPTRLGPGAGLEVGNSIYFDMPASQFSYWNADDRAREAIRRLIRSGHIDCLHSFGDLATTRAHAGRALDELAQHDCAMKVWIDHAVAPSNFGADIMRKRRRQDSEAYHADLTCGPASVCLARPGDGVIGQDIQGALAASRGGTLPLHR